MPTTTAPPAPAPAGDAGAGASEGGGVLDVSRANAARVYDYWAGGKDHFAVDRAAGDAVARLAPWVVQGARTNRMFLRRATEFLARAGVRQFLDIGAGLPGRAPVHEVAAAIRPDARVVYVDHDPVVLVHARALLQDRNTAVAAGDVRDPGAILADPAVRDHLDLTRPVAVLLLGLLHFVREEEDPAAVVAVLRDALAPGSYIVISHAADLPGRGRFARRAEASREAARLYRQLVTPAVLRTGGQIAALFAGLQMVEPGLVGAHEWHPPRRRPRPPVPLLAGIGRVP